MKLRNIGLSSMLLVLIVLALTLFSVLSLSEALRDREMAMRYAQAETAYYAADTQAVRWRAERLEQGTASGATADFAIDEARTLHVELDVDGNAAVWRVVITDSTEMDDRLPVWEGNNE